MSYPLSAEVVPGQATEADQYNNLRKDALYLGADPSASGTVRDLLAQGIGEINLIRSSATVITLEASAETPAGIVIGGVICSAAESKSITLTAETLKDAGRYTLYAVSDGNGGFTLAAGSTGPSGSRAIGTFIWTGTGIIPGTVRTITEYRMIQASKEPAAAAGRLTLVAGDPLPATDITAAEALYFVPYQGNMIGLYLYGGWEYFSFGVITLQLQSLLRGVPYDVFLGTGVNGLTLTVEPWSGASARPAGTLTRVDGVRVSGADPGKRYLGTFAVNESGYAEDSITGRLLWNENNRAARPLLSKLTGSGDAISVIDTWVPYFSVNAPSVRVLLPDASAELDLEGTGKGTAEGTSDITYGRFQAVGIGQDISKNGPFTNNANIAPVIMHTYGNGPVTVRLTNYSSELQGLHEYTLIYRTNYTLGPELKPSAGDLPGCGAGLAGYVMG